MNRKLKELIERLDYDWDKYGDSEITRLLFERYGRDTVEKEYLLTSLNMVIEGLSDLVNFMDKYEEEYE